MLQEVKVWHLACDDCKRDGGTITSRFRPPLPTGWTYRTTYGMYHGKVQDVCCEDCTASHEAEASGPTGGRDDG